MHDDPTDLWIAPYPAPAGLRWIRPFRQRQPNTWVHLGPCATAEVATRRATLALEEGAAQVLLDLRLPGQPWPSAEDTLEAARDLGQRNQPFLALVGPDPLLAQTLRTLGAQGLVVLPGGPAALVAQICAQGPTWRGLHLGQRLPPNLGQAGRAWFNPPRWWAPAT